jgi:hypothetical protein
MLCPTNNCRRADEHDAKGCDVPAMHLRIAERSIPVYEQPGPFPFNADGMHIAPIADPARLRVTTNGLPPTEPAPSGHAPLSDADIERIARRVAELFREAAEDNAAIREAPAFTGTVDELERYLAAKETT